MTLTQLSLDICLDDDATFASYYAGSNKEVMTAIMRMAAGDGEQFAYLWGGIGVGKTHLLQAACHMAIEYNISAVYLSLEQLLVNTTAKADEMTSNKLAVDTIARLQGLENLALVCLDRVDIIAGNEQWEEGLFHLFNRIKDNGSKLIIAADSSPMHLSVKLSDLKSRLSWGVVYHLHALGDEGMLAAIQLRAKCRGLILDDLTGNFLLRRCARDMWKLFQVLEQLDRASLAEQRRLTIPFVKQVLGL